MQTGATLLRWSDAVPGGRPALTLGVLVGVAAVVLLVRRAGPALRERFDETAVDVGQFVVVGTTVALGLWLLVYAWGASDDVASALSVLEVGQAEAVIAVVTVAVLAGAYGLTRLSARVIYRSTRNNDAISSHEREIAYHVVQMAIYVTAGLVVLSLWNVRIGNLLLGAGVLGIVVGLAARQTLGAVLAGFVVLFSRPFEIGDWVEIGDNEGIVTDITIVNTRLQTFDGEYVMLPNDIVSSEEVVNRSRKGRLRLTVEVGVDYASDVDRAVEVAREAMRDVDPILAVPQPEVVAAEFGDSAVLLRLRFWIDNPSARRKWRAKSAVVRAVKGAFDREGIKIPFPQRELTGRAETGGMRVRRGDGEAASDPAAEAPRAEGDGA
ncbi:MAG: mechanosensitive ion channel family protein [Halobacteriaceae archaeon]